MPVVVKLTATTPGPCGCCGIGSTTLQCRTRGGTASLCGYSEYVNPSVPPKKYLKRTLGGASNFNHYPNVTCTGADCTETFTFSGTCSYDPATCALTVGGQQVIAGSCSGFSPGTYPQCQVRDPSGIFGDTETFTQTTRTVGGAHICFVAGGESANQTVSLMTETLSDEDTETNAINRLLAGPGGTWSAWTTVGDGTGGTCLPQNCCEAYYEQRTGFTFGYQESQFKADMTALDPLTNYVLTMQVFRRPQGSTAPWVLLLEDAYAFTTDGSGNATITDDVLNLEGYETYVANPFIYKP